MQKCFLLLYITLATLEQQKKLELKFSLMVRFCNHDTGDTDDKAGIARIPDFIFLASNCHFDLANKSIGL